MANRTQSLFWCPRNQNKALKKPTASTWNKTVICVCCFRHSVLKEQPKPHISDICIISNDICCVLCYDQAMTCMAVVHPWSKQVDTVSQLFFPNMHNVNFSERKEPLTVYTFPYICPHKRMNEKSTFRLLYPEDSLSSLHTPQVVFIQKRTVSISWVSLKSKQKLWIYDFKALFNLIFALGRYLIQAGRKMPDLVYCSGVI